MSQSSRVKGDGAHSCSPLGALYRELIPEVMATDSAGNLRSDSISIENLDSLLSTPASCNWAEALGHLDARLQSLSNGPWVTSLETSIKNTALVLPLTQELFCLAQNKSLDALMVQCDLFVDHLNRLLARYNRDHLEARGAIVDIQTWSGETHNGRRRLFKIVTAEGSAFAYKDRPVQGEAIFLGLDGVFRLISQLSRNTVPVYLPFFAVDLRQDEYGSYGWHQWIECTPDRYHRVGSASVITNSINPSRKLWRALGCLSAAAAAFGISDLGEDNVVLANLPQTPTTTDEQVQHLVPIDIEVFLTRNRDLLSTQLIAANTSDSHHAGIEEKLRACTGGGPLFYIDAHAGTLTRRTKPCARTVSKSLIVDDLGQTGYASNLTHYLRGIFDTWIVMCQNTETIDEALARLCHNAQARNLIRSTSQYLDTLFDDAVSSEQGWRDSGGAAFTPEEREALDHYDVPYFTSRIGQIDWSSGMTLSKLGQIVRQSVEYVKEQLSPMILDTQRGVRVASGQPTRNPTQKSSVAFRWEQTDRWVIFQWDDHKLELSFQHAHQPGTRIPPQDAWLPLCERLQRLDRVDASMRTSWTRSGFKDAALRMKLDRLEDSAASWIDTVTRGEGWPTADRVGTHAASCALRLAQHLERHQRVQDHCLREIVDAAHGGRASWAEVAAVSDACDVRDGKEQRFGTKFERRDGSFVPYALNDPENVDERRRAMAMPSLDSNLDKLNVWAEKVGLGEP